MNSQKLLMEFNPSKFIVYNCLLVFTMLFALKLDETIRISYWLVFMPLFIWKLILILVAASLGTYVWVKNPSYRLTDASYIHLKSMLISLSIQFLLLMFECFCCDKLESGRHLWVLVFVPLIFISLLSFAICFWSIRSIKNDRSFELELFFSVNIIQFIFIALRLDRFILWSWMIVFVPLWILIFISIIGCLYALIFFLILLRSPEVGVEQRKASLHTAISYSLVVIPFLIFLFLLANKLDSIDPTLHYKILFNFVSNSSLNSFRQMNYFTICIPLYFAFIILICLSFGSKTDSCLFGGLRKDFGSFLLSTFPCLKEYANMNISYSKTQLNSNLTSSDNQGQLQNDSQRIDLKYKIKNKSKNVPVVPQLTLEKPD